MLRAPAARVSAETSVRKVDEIDSGSAAPAVRLFVSEYARFQGPGRSDTVPRSPAVRAA